MERDAIISHGASAVLQERLCTSSDAYKTVFCEKCGTIAISSYAGHTCRKCGDQASFGVCTLPRGFLLLTHLLDGAGIHMTFDMKRAPESLEQLANQPTVAAPGVPTGDIVKEGKQEVGM